jgi:hypothetical protein
MPKFYVTNYDASTVEKNWYTVQVKYLTTRDQTVEHKYGKNCDHPGYNRTSTLCFVVRDKTTGVSSSFSTHGARLAGTWIACRDIPMI